jgi:Flp pilus assembly protein TadG
MRVKQDDRKDTGAARSTLTRLARDTGGNTLAMMAAAMIPITALAGSAIDTARMYVVKVRLQQACDAGVLAGRKFMVSSNNAALDATAVTQAKAFFANNFPSGFMGTAPFNATTNPYPFTPTKTADQQVSATATATVPMTIMKMFAAPDVKLDVVCEARYDIADADIMLVLDTTGSMACAATEAAPCGQPTSSYTRPDGTIGFRTDEKTTSRIRALRTAVLNFYDTVTTTADPTTNLRYGFVSYTSTVNAGAAVRSLSPNFIVDQWTYPSRRIVGDSIYGTTSEASFANISEADCNARVGRSPTTALTYNSNGTASRFTKKSWTANGFGNAAVGTCVITTQPIRPLWRYENLAFNTSQFKLGNAVVDPSKLTGATTRWQGCLEERNTTTATTFDPANLPPDLDPDLAPNTATPGTLWRPMWPEVVYYRGNTTSVDFSGTSTAVFGDYHYPDSANAADAYTNIPATARPGLGDWDDNIRGGYVSCGKPVERLRTMTRTDVENYVNASDFVPQGGTYHDTGMIWGLRMLSPTGPFAADTAAWPGRNAPNRFLIFMTDGDMSPNSCLYGMYGIENYAARVTGSTSGSCNANGLARHNARFQAVCSAAKARNIRVFVVAFGQTLTTDLTNCASPGQAYYASNNTALNTAFADIAKQVAMLRVSK